MKRSGCRTIFHICLIFVLSLLGALLMAVCLFFMTITIRKPDGKTARSDWPIRFTEEFKDQIIFAGTVWQVKQAGLAALQDNGIGVQLLDASGREVFGYQKPEQAGTAYTNAELLELYHRGQMENSATTPFMGAVSHAGKECVYILYFPVSISKVTMYLSGERFAGGRAILLPILRALLLLVLFLGVLYGLFMTKAMKRLTAAVKEISDRSYLPVQEPGLFRDLYGSLNMLDAEIRAGDRLRAQTDKMREEWIANITHDLKTPLSPIRGYAELLGEDGGKTEEQCRRYAGIMLKNAAYMEALIDDLKLTYQLENGMLCANRKEQNLIRFLRELVIDILNTPEYENRAIDFESTANAVSFSFDQRLFTRAFRNLIINAFVHGKDDTKVFLCLRASDTMLKIEVADNGRGMSPELAEHMFDRYYRGTGTEQKTEGSGLGLAIAKGIIELHGGKITAVSIPAAGTTFFIEFLRS